MSDPLRTPLASAALAQAFDDSGFRALLLHRTEPAEILALLRGRPDRDALPEHPEHFVVSTASRREYATG